MINFVSDLCAVFFVIIPFNKLQDPLFHGFLKKYANQDILHPSTIRKYDVPKQCDKAINQIKSKEGEDYFRINADETTDIKGRYVVNVMHIALTMHPENPPMSFKL